MPLFVADDGGVLLPTARHIWDLLLSANLQVDKLIDASASLLAYETSLRAAEANAEPIYKSLVREHEAQLAWEGERAINAFAARRKMVERIGLPEVRNYRLKLLIDEERHFHEEQEKKTRVLPDLTPLVFLRVER